MSTNEGYGSLACGQEQYRAREERRGWRHMIYAVVCTSVNGPQWQVVMVVVLEWK
jgi:hypothetical protein